MASPRSTTLLAITLTFFFFFFIASNQVQALHEEDLEWPVPLSISNVGGESALDLVDDFMDNDDESGGHYGGHGRSLFWKGVVHYYISYGALSANRIPCPPRSGRSYYTHNCFKSRVPVNPYSRGCSRITRCRR